MSKITSRSDVLITETAVRSYGVCTNLFDYWLREKWLFERRVNARKAQVGYSYTMSATTLQLLWLNPK